MRRCARCGAILSAYALPHERFCWPCHPGQEKRPRVCAEGHPLDVHGVTRANGKTYCGTCRREHERARYRPRIAA